jgi:hypothetical protein
LNGGPTLIVTKGKRLLFTCFILLACAPTYVQARPGPIKNLIEERDASPETANNDNIERELDLFRATRVSIQAALMVARNIHAGSKVLDVSFDGASGTPIYRVVTYRGNSVWDSSVDGNTAMIVGETLSSPASSLTPADKDNLIALSLTRLGILDAISLSERNSSGRAISAGVMKVHGKLNFIIVVVIGSKLKQFFLEPPRTNGPTFRDRRRR